MRLYNIDVADSEPESGEFKPDIPQNAVQKLLEMISSSFSCGIPVNSSSVGSGMASDDEPANLTKRNLYLLMFARAVLIAILLIQAYREPLPLYVNEEILSSALSIESCTKSLASSRLSEYRRHSVKSLAAYLVYSSSCACLCKAWPGSARPILDTLYNFITCSSQTNNLLLSQSHQFVF